MNKQPWRWKDREVLSLLWLNINLKVRIILATYVVSQFWITVLLPFIIDYCTKLWQGIWTFESEIACKIIAENYV